jgi:hypothetical protein
MYLLVDEFFRFRFAVRIPAPDLRRIERFGQQFLNGSLKNGMNEMRCQFDHRNENEFPLVQTGMRQSQKRRIEMNVPEKKQIEIHGARGVFEFIAASQKIFDADHPREHLRRRDVRHGDFGDHVQKIIGIIDADRLGLVNGRKPVNLDARFEQTADGEKQISRPVAEIRA